MLLVLRQEQHGLKNTVAQNNLFHQLLDNTMKITKEQLQKMILEEISTLTELRRFPAADKPLSALEFFNASFQSLQGPLDSLKEILYRGYLRGKGPVSKAVFLDTMEKANALEKMIKNSAEMRALDQALSDFAAELNRSKEPNVKKS
jgi:hypothetical protein